MKHAVTALLLMTLTSTVMARSGQKAIYGSIDMEFTTNRSEDRIKNMATGISYIVNKNRISQEANGVSIIRAETLKDMVNLCRNEPFAKNMATANCTGFLISKDKVITAGHCIKNDSCAHLSFVFGVTVAKEVREGFAVDTSNIYSCKKVISANQEGNDFAVIQLNRNVEARHIFELGDDANLTEKSKVYMLGHPLGMAMTYSRPAPVSRLYAADKFAASLDSFGGNSGSPVIDPKTDEVVGILTSGRTDFEEKSNCKKFAKYNDGGETITRISVITPYID